jgi:hypothetical protein
MRPLFSLPAYRRRVTSARGRARLRRSGAPPEGGASDEAAVWGGAPL